LDIEAENVLFGRPLLKDEIQADTATIIQYEVEKLINLWRKDPKQTLFLERKAKDKGKDYETVLQEDARWVIQEKLINGELF
jgi:hypothetical protein